MGKVVKFIAGIALNFIPGVGPIASALFFAGTSIASSLLKSKPKVSNSRGNLDRLRASIDPRTPRQSAVGITAQVTDIR